jgi:hypothetical protein
MVHFDLDRRRISVAMEEETKDAADNEVRPTQLSLR